MDWLRSVFLREWPAIKPVLRPFVICLAVSVVFVALALWRLLSVLDGRQIDSLKATIQFQDEQLTSLRQSQAAVEAVPPSQWRRLTDVERTCLAMNLGKMGARPKQLVVWAMAASEPRQFAAQFVDLLRAAGVTIIPREVPLSTTADVGLMVGVVNIRQPLPQSLQFQNWLQQCGLAVHLTPWLKEPLDPTADDFDLFVGPKPW
jgi:hypothetical protein